jgi:hypothetical protein
MLLSHHISSTARQRILQELAHRARQIMEGVAYSWYVKPSLCVRRSYVLQETNISDHAESCCGGRKHCKPFPDQFA